MTRLSGFPVVVALHLFAEHFDNVYAALEYSSPGMHVFRFLDDEEFAKLDYKARAGYLVRAQQELMERQLTLREQMRRTVGIDTEATIPAVEPSQPESNTRLQK